MSEEMKWVLTDNSKRVYVENCVIDPTLLHCSCSGNWSVVKTRLKGGLSDGVDIIEVNNGRLSFTVIPTRGMGLWRGSCDGCSLGWDSPAKYPVNPMFINTLEQGGLGWLKGFNECIVRCGLNSNGAPGIDSVIDNNGNLSEVMLSLHGNIANLPANYVEVTIVPDGVNTKIIVKGIVDEARCFCPQYRLVSTFTTIVGSNKVDIKDEVTNWADSPTEFEMLYHCNFGQPFLEAGSKLVCPAIEVAPRDPRAAEDIKTWDTYKAPEAGYVEQGNYLEMAAKKDGSTLSMIRNKKGDKGVIMRFNKKQLPSFCQWKHTTGMNEGYVTGMEPAVNYPNNKCFERKKGRVLTLAPQQTYTIDLTLEVQTTAAGVAAIEKEVAAIMGKKKTVVHDNPIAKWSPIEG